MAGDPAVAGQTREKGRLLDGRQWHYEPLAAIEFHVRIRGASCVGFFSCHIDLSFLLSSEVDHLTDATELLSVGNCGGCASIVLSFAGRGNANSGWFKLPFWVGRAWVVPYAG
jgi:hypothetical protein